MLRFGTVPLDRSTAIAVGEFPRGSEGRIADFFGIEALGWVAPEEAVQRVCDRFFLGRFSPGGLPIGRARQDRPVQFLHFPIVAEKARGEPVEQLGMARWFTEHPKSFGVATSPSAKWRCQIRFTMTRAVKGF